MGNNELQKFEKYLKNYHNLSYREYSEIYLMSPNDDSNFCFSCKDHRLPLTYLMRDLYYLPCWECVPKRKGEKLETVRRVIWDIKDFYDKVLGDRYLQLFIIDDIYFNSTLPHSYFEFKSILGKLNLPSRNDIWFLDWKIGYPKIINSENLEGLKIVNLSRNYTTSLSSSGNIRINDFEILQPEIVPYDVRHHSRYNILNKGSDRKTKRLKINGTSDCIKFYNTSDDSVKSIFKITKNGAEIDVSDLSYQDLVIIKLAILRNKNYVRRIFEIVFEILNSTGTFSDFVFLKNTVQIDPEKLLDLGISWTGSVKNNFLNISIL